MKKLSIVAICLLICSLTAAFAACGYSNQLSLSIGDGIVPDDAVTIQIDYNDTWTSSESEPLLSVKCGHESDAVLADEYSLALSDADPLFAENGYTMTAIATFTKADIEGVSADGGKVSGSSSDVLIGELGNYLPKGEGVITAYFVFYSSNTDFKDVTTYSAHEFSYEWVGDNQIQLV